MPTLFRRRAVSSTRRSPYHTDDESDAPTHSGAEDEHVVPPSMSSAPRSALRTSTTRSSSRPKMVRVGTDGSNEMSRARAHAPGSMSRREIREEVEDIKRRIASLERAIKRRESRIDELDSPAKDPEGLVRAQWRRMMPNLAVGHAFLPRKENGNIKKSYLALLEYQPRHPNWVAMQRQNHDAWDWMRVDAARLEWKYLGVKPEEGHLLMDRFFALVFAIEAKERKIHELQSRLDELVGAGHIQAEEHDPLPYYSDSDGDFRPTVERPSTPGLTKEQRSMTRGFRGHGRIAADQIKEAFRRRSPFGDTDTEDEDEDERPVASSSRAQRELGRMGFRAARRYSFSREAF
ncbi:hypothetical protein NBRC10512_004178 [Rhodotorula toruloides]|uniref:RHTO0S12e00188g1_1 n=2 Tax=Rhodotorula toruloides TaxID=5286 RepID=A0A061B847_RHOTO|nr:uncharacterized protein RHTO_07674 [Rhodotorula toruloides NP11]EMS23332.1 hypothetical protein RHTO_07674 [Rhodotorula toruloides NP11]CDR46090.1 RHTO0S12e00188g1_1 [Rhodotorula toruloides]